MDILGQKFKIVDTFDVASTVPDCFVVYSNKLGKGHGEAKFYISSKDQMRKFYGGEGFNAKCFLLKKDLVAYMNAIKPEYANPTQNYNGRESLMSLWTARMEKVNKLGDVIEFHIQDQTQIAGPRGYVNSKDDGYNLIRELSLPLVSYVSAMELADSSSTRIYYWKLFADYDAISGKSSASVFQYGRHKKEGLSEPGGKKKTRKEKEIRDARVGQGLYREKLLNECPFCPITKINDERLLVASHIKPWAASDAREKTDPKNGFILSPLYDRLFDRGFITFTEKRRVVVSNWLSPQNQKRIGVKNDDFIQLLPLDEEREKYLEYHRNFVFKG